MNIQSMEITPEMFNCKRCQACCKQPGFVYLSLAEAEAIAHFKQMDIRDFVNDFCELQDRRQLVLKKQKDEVCIFLNHDSCQIHEVKPKQCADFPIRWRTPKSYDYCLGLKEAVLLKEGK